MNNGMLNAATYRGPRRPEDHSIPIGLRKRDSTLVRAKVKYVDLERLTMTCETFFTHEIIMDIGIAMPYAGPMSFISSVPEENSVVILAKVMETYFPIAYLPTYSFALQQDYIKSWPESVQAKDNDIFFKHRKLRQGELNLGSAQGSELF